jgi:hypothetical protein
MTDLLARGRVFQFRGSGRPQQHKAVDIAMTPLPLIRRAPVVATSLNLMTSGSAHATCRSVLAVLAFVDSDVPSKQRPDCCKTSVTTPVQQCGPLLACPAFFACLGRAGAEKAPSRQASGRKPSRFCLMGASGAPPFVPPTKRTRPGEIPGSIHCTPSRVQPRRPPRHCFFRSTRKLRNELAELLCLRTAMNSVRNLASPLRSNHSAATLCDPRPRNGL